MPVVSSILSVISSKYFWIGSILLVCYLYYIATTSKIHNLEKKNEVLLEQTVGLQAQQKNLLENYKKIEVYNKDNIDLIKKLDIKTQKNKESLFRELKNKKSIEYLALRKTILVEKAVNDGTKKSLDCLEKVTAGEVC